MQPIAVHTPRLDEDDDALPAAPLELDDDLEVDGRDVTVIDGDPSGAIVHDVRIVRSRLSRVSIAGLNARGLELRDVVLHTVDAAGSQFGEAALTRVLADDCRLTGLDLAGAELQHVEFRGCRLDDANFRMIEASNVAFAGCDLRAADFGQAVLRRVSFAGSNLDGADFSNARCEQVDLRGARLDTLRGANGLRGAVIGVDQVLPLAPALLADLGITIAGDDIGNGREVRAD